MGILNMKSLQMHNAWNVDKVSESACSHYPPHRIGYAG
jgi:hypothetical protein